LAAANETLQVQVDSRMRAEQKLQQLNTDLERRVTQDTLDLNAAHKDLLHSVDERNELQDELRHSQKMETLGTLAGGIAHDSSNLLHVIQGYVKIMREDVRDPLKLEEYLQIIDETVKEGAALTHQLLTVARKNKVKFELTSVHSLITTLGEMVAKHTAEDH
jgi:signal transduction histidine kinase